MLFVFFSVLTLLGPIAYYHSHSETKPDSTLLERSRGGKPAEIFRSVSDLLHIPVVGYHGFNEALARISFESHRFGREVKGLAFLMRDTSKNLSASDFAAELDRLAGLLDARVDIPCQIANLRFLLCSTISNEDAALRSSECQVFGPPGSSSWSLQCTKEEGSALAPDILLVIEDLLKPQPEQIKGISSQSQGDDGSEPPKPPTDPNRISIATLQKHIIAKRSEMFRLLSNPPLTKRARDSRASVVSLAKDLLDRTQSVQLLATRIRDTSCAVSIALALLAALFWYRMWAGRKYALGRGRWRAQLIVYVFLVLQMYNVVLLGAYEPESRVLDEESLVVKTDFLREAYRTAAQEIQHRLEQEQHFYILKFTMIGSLLAVFFRFLLSPEGTGQSEETDSGSATEERGEESSEKRTRTQGEQRTKEPSRWSHVRRKIGTKDAIDRLRESKIAAFFFWAAVIINCIVDTRLRYNAVICTALGRWIRTLEGSIEEHGLAGWETFFEQQALISSSPLMQIAPTLLTTIVFILTVVLFLAKERAVISLRGNVHDNLKQVNLVFGSVAFLVMAFSGLGRPSMPWQWLIPVVVWVVAGVTLLYLGPQAINGRVFRRDEITDALIGYAFPFHYFDLHKRLPPPKTREQWARRAAARAWFRLYGALFRVASYLPIPGLRRRLVNSVHASLGVELIHLEINNDPPLGQFLNELHDLPDADSLPWCWSVMYLRTGEAGLSRLIGGNPTQPLAAPLGDESESAQLAREWLNRRLRYITPSTEAPSGFQIQSPSNLMVTRGGDDKPVPCEQIYYCRVHDFYDEHNPWILFICVVAPAAIGDEERKKMSRGGEQDKDCSGEKSGNRGEKEQEGGDGWSLEVVVFSAKDGDTHRLGVAGKWLGDLAPVPAIGSTGA